MKKILLTAIFTCYLTFFVNAANILLLEQIPSPSHHVWYEQIFIAPQTDALNFHSIPRLKNVVTALAARGHNVTSLSPDEEPSSESIHYIHMDKVYETLYSAEETGEEINFFEMGQQGFVEQLYGGVKFILPMCTGYLQSTGWEVLSRYPDDFKVKMLLL